MMLAGRGAQIGVRIADGMTDGVVIEEVQPDSPAEKAGLKPSDVIVEFGGEHVRSARQFGRLVQETPPGRAAPESSRRTSGVKQRSANASAERRGLRLDHLRRRGGKDDGEMRSEDGGERLDEL